MPDFIELLLKTAGVIGALLALGFAARSHAERATFDMIDRMYTLCHTLQGHALKEWCVAHLYCIGNVEYEAIKASIKEGLATDQKKLSEYRVKERLFAIHIFVVYEHVYYQWTHTKWWMHPARREFLGAMLSYFTDRVLQNPRLLHFLKEDEHGASLHLERESKDYVDKVIKRKPMSNLRADSEGPYGVG